MLCRFLVFKYQPPSPSPLLLAGGSDDYLFDLSTAAGLGMPVIVRPEGGAGVLDLVGGADRL